MIWFGVGVVVGWFLYALMQDWFESERRRKLRRW